MARTFCPPVASSKAVSENLRELPQTRRRVDETPRGTGKNLSPPLHPEGRRFQRFSRNGCSGAKLTSRKIMQGFRCGRKHCIQ